MSELKLGSADSEGLDLSTRPLVYNLSCAKKSHYYDLFLGEREMLFLTGRIKVSLVLTIKVLPLLPGDRRAGSAGMRGGVSWDRRAESVGTAPNSRGALLPSYPAPFPPNRLGWLKPGNLKPWQQQPR